jgi:5-methylcytosine-specific restriction protein A
MPNAPLKPCSYPGCSELVTSGRCAKHSTQVHQPYHRDPDRQHLYNTKRWRLRRARQLARQPWCEECQRHGLSVPATDVDHIEPHRGDPVKFATGQLQSLCHRCHSAKTKREVIDPRGGEKDLARGAQSGRGHPREKNSQCGESGLNPGGRHNAS